MLDATKNSPKRRGLQTTVLTSTLSEAREKRHISIRALAERAGVQPSTVWRCEVGLEVTLTNAIKITRVLGLRVDDVFKLVAARAVAESDVTFE